MNSERATRPRMQDEVRNHPTSRTHETCHNNLMNKGREVGGRRERGGSNKLQPLSMSHSKCCRVASHTPNNLYKKLCISTLEQICSAFWKKKTIKKTYVAFSPPASLCVFAVQRRATAQTNAIGARTMQAIAVQPLGRWSFCASSQWSSPCEREQ